MPRDHNLVSVGAYITRGSNIHSCDTAQSNRIDGFPVGENIVAVKIRHREGRLVQNHGVSVSSLLL